MRGLAGLVVVAFGLYLLGLAAVLVAHPARARRFLGAFGQTAPAHVTEQAARLGVGVALVVYAPSMAHPAGFGLFGWVLIATSVGLLLLPWRWHQRFADRVVPGVLGLPWLVAFGAAALGAFVVWGVAAGLG